MADCPLRFDLNTPVETPPEMLVKDAITVPLDVLFSGAQAKGASLRMMVLEPVLIHVNATVIGVEF